MLENTNITIICQAEGGRPPAKVGLFSIVIVAIVNKIMATTNITVIIIIAILTIMVIIMVIVLKEKPINAPGDVAYTRIALNVCPFTHKVFQYLSLILAVVAVFFFHQMAKYNSDSATYLNLSYYLINNFKPLFGRTTQSWFANIRLCLLKPRARLIIR